MVALLAEAIGDCTAAETNCKMTTQILKPSSTTFSKPLHTNPTFLALLQLRRLVPSQKRLINNPSRPRSRTDLKREDITIAKNTSLSMGMKPSSRMVAYRNRLVEAGAEVEVMI